MATYSYVLAPNARWQGRDQTGEPVINGKLYTYQNGTTVNKPTYQDYQGTQANTNPVILDGKGEANIYWATDDLYSIALYDENDNLIYTQDNYPIIGSNTTEVVGESESNICRNEQFTYWTYGTSFVLDSSVTTTVNNFGSQNNDDYVADDWLFKRNSSNYKITLSRQAFDVDEDAVPANPAYYFEYDCDETPNSSDDIRLYQRYTSARTLAGETVTISFYAKSPNSAPISVYLVQDFGSGGSDANTITVFDSQALTSNWVRYTATVDVTVLQTEVIGTDDALELKFQFPNDRQAKIHLCNIQMQVGSAATNFPIETFDAQFKELNCRINNGISQTGDVKATLRTAADPGWFLMQDQTIGCPGSGADEVGVSLKPLYTYLWGLSSVVCPIYDKDGVTTTRGASADDDYYAMKRLGLTRTAGRMIACAGQGILVQQATTYIAGTPTGFLVPQADNIYYTGTPVKFNLRNDQQLPTPIESGTSDTVYYVTNSYTDPGGGRLLYLSTNYQNAINGSYVVFTDLGGGGPFDMQIDYTNFSVGNLYGEEQHGLTINEMPAHNHDILIIGAQPTTQILQVNANTTTNGSNPNVIQSKGGSTPHNIMQPTVFFNYMIKI